MPATSVLSPAVEPQGMLRIEPLRAFTDNYIWLLTRGRRAVVVDPGEATPVRGALAARQLQLEAILVTHHHADHTGGVTELVRAGGVRVYGPATETFDTGGATLTPLAEGARLKVLDETVRVFDVPGHTAGHIAYYFDRAPAALFCGDTLFAGGCGRLFEGTPAQMLESLRKFAALPAATRVYCAHEYTLANLRFALAVEPDNRQLRQRQIACAARRASGEATVPSTLAEERATNPFLRIAEPAVVAAVRRRAPAAGADLATEVDVFAALRHWKDGFG